MSTNCDCENVLFYKQVMANNVVKFVMRDIVQEANEI